MILSLCPNPSVDKILKVDSLRPGQVHRTSSEHAYPGGKGVHVALAVNELGKQAKLGGFWGGPSGDWIFNQCSEKGIHTFGPRLNGWTRTCLTITSDDGTETEIRENGPSVSNSDLDQFFGQIRDQLNDTSLLCISGSWPPGTPEGVYRSLSDLCESTRTSLWVDASGKWLEESCRTEPFAIHVNRAEAAELFGPGRSAGSYASQLSNVCELAAVTDGADGLWLASGRQLVHASCKVETIHSTVGCGDALTAGLIAAFLENKSLEEMAKNAVASGSANCLTPELGLIRKSDVEQLAGQTNVNIHELK